MLKLSKRQQKEYSMLTKRFKISKREYLDLYKDVRKSRAKASRLRKEGGVLKIPKYSTNFTYLKDRKDFLALRSKTREMLKRDFKRKINHQQRQTLYNNVLKYYGNQLGMDIIQEFEQLDDYEVQDFFDDNDDLDTIMYDSDSEILNILNVSHDKFIGRFENYATK